MNYNYEPIAEEIVTAIFVIQKKKSSQIKLKARN